MSVDLDLANKLAAEEGTEIVNHVRGGKTNVAVQLSNSSYSPVQSGISFLYRQSVVKRTPEIKEVILLYCKSSKRKGRYLKQSAGLVIREVKNPMSQEMYSFIAKNIFIS